VNGCPCPSCDDDPAAAATVALIAAADRAAGSLVAGSIARALDDARTARLFTAEQSADA
jgi:inhibitor of KinA sporulation pathway (predicted exonuclease)